MTSVLGCGTYAAEIRWRPGAPPQFSADSILFARIERAQELRWERRLDETATAQLVLGPEEYAALNCCPHGTSVLGKCVDERCDYEGLVPWAHELWIYRDGQCIWQGPIITVTQVLSTGKLTIDARDMTAWLEVRYNELDYNLVGVDIADVLLAVINDVILKDSPFFRFEIDLGTGYLTDFKAGLLTANGGQVLRDLTKTGLDFTTYGRTLYIRREVPPNEATPYRLEQQHLITDLEVINSGQDTASRIIASSNDFLTAIPRGIFDTTAVGLVERSVKVDYGNPTDVAWAEQFDAWPPPIIVRVPDDAQLTPDAPITVDELFCGVRIDLLIDALCAPLRQAMRLIRVSGTYTAEGEKIGVTFLPYTPEITRREIRGDAENRISAGS